MNKKAIIKCLEKNVLLYEKNLNHKEFLLLAKYANDILPFKLSFLEANFLHLTGLKTTMNAVDFYKAILNKQLNEKAFECKYNDLMMSKKLDMLPYLTEFYKYAKNIGDYNNNGFNLKTDKIVGNTFMSIGFIYVGSKRNYLRPNSLMQADSRTLTKQPFMPIIAILSKQNNEKLFNNITYKSKNINIDKIHFPQDLKNMLSENILNNLKPSLFLKNTKEFQRNIPNLPKVQTKDNSNNKSISSSERRSLNDFKFPKEQQSESTVQNRENQPQNRNNYNDFSR